jgi:hypothetical protein
MRRLAALVFTGALGALTLGLGCSSDNTEPPAGTGGAPGSGGKPAGSGGMQATGSGGHVGTGGVPNVGVGGSGTGGMNAGSGGMPNSGTGGDHSTGGVSGGSGGHVGTGGVPNPGSGGSGTDGGTTNCVGRAISLSANGTGTASDSALARVEIDLASDLPIGNSQRTVEFWAFIKTTDWVGDKNEVYYYGGTANATAFGLDFGTNPVMGMANNHATLNPVTAGGFNDDSTNDLGINSSTDQWVHIAMVWNGTNVITYVNGLPKITTAGNGVTALATTQSVVDIGCNPTNNQCFNGLFDELRIWKVARTATQIHDNYNKPVATNETGLVGYWKFDETSGTTTADAVTGGGHTAHNGTLKADTTAHNPTFVVPPTPLPLVCP